MIDDSDATCFTCRDGIDGILHRAGCENSEEHHESGSGAFGKGTVGDGRALTQGQMLLLHNTRIRECAEVAEVVVLAEVNFDDQRLGIV